MYDSSSLEIRIPGIRTMKMMKGRETYFGVGACVGGIPESTTEVDFSETERMVSKLCVIE